MQMHPVLIGSGELAIDKTVRGRVVLYSCSPLDRNTDESEMIFNMRAGLHSYRQWSQNMKMQKRRSNAFQVSRVSKK